MALCHICNKRAAKRSCPAVAAGICPICCARDRMVNLACPESCAYLRSGRESAMAREKAIRAKWLSERGPTNFRLSEAQAMASEIVEAAVIEVQRESLRDLDDEEVVAALRNARENLETFDSGIIYEHQAVSRRVQQVSLHIREKLEKVAAEPGLADRILRNDMIEALRLLQEGVEAHLKYGNDPRGYVRMTALHIPWPPKAHEPLIIT